MRNIVCVNRDTPPFNIFLQIKRNCDNMKIYTWEFVWFYRNDFVQLAHKSNDYFVCVCFAYNMLSQAKPSQLMVMLVDTQNMDDYLQCYASTGNLKIKMTKVEQNHKMNRTQTKMKNKKKTLALAAMKYQTRVTDFNFQSFNHWMSEVKWSEVCMYKFQWACSLRNCGISSSFVLRCHIFAVYRMGSSSLSMV